MGPGDVLAARFEIERLAGAGGMGVVYRALDRVTGTLVAVKVLKSGDADDERFIREARVLSDLRHPSIVRYVAHGSTAQGEPFLAMEWLEGEDLAHRLARGGLGAAESVTVARRVAEGLGVAHARSVVHRDVKPSNVFLVGGDPARAKLLDFGIVRLQRAANAPTTRPVTRTGLILGTVGYMSPEQATADRALDARADIFALGCVLFECLTGEPAFSGAHVVAVLAKVLRGEAPRLRQFRPDLSPMLEELLVRMLSKDRAQRPPDGGAMLEELEALGTIEGGAPEVIGRPSAGLSGGEQRLVSVTLAVIPDEPDRVSEIVRRYGGDQARLSNGTVLVTLSSRGTPGERVVTAAVCALELYKAFPSASIALATGRAQTTAEGPSGPVIDRAAALLAKSTSSGIRIDELTAGLLGERFDMQTSGEGQVLIGQKSEDEPPRTLLGKPTPCVGRDKELGLLDATLRECIDESVARAVVVTGPAGQGKSRLRHEFVAKARGRGDVTILTARADPVGAGSAFMMVRQLVRQAVGFREGDPAPEQNARLRAYIADVCKGADSARIADFLGELIGVPSIDVPSPQLRSARNDPQTMAIWLGRSFGEWLAAECSKRSLLIVLDDLHWGDLPSVTYLTEGLRALSARPLLVVALGRPEVDDLFPNLWTGADKIQIPLARLTPRASERLVRAALGSKLTPDAERRLIERADGNAFYLEELIRRVAEGASEELPETVIALAQSRLDRLEPEPRRILRAASVFGEIFWSGGIAALLGSSSGQADIEPWLNALVDREVVVAGRGEKLARGQAYTFRHGLLREVAYSMLTDTDRVTGHRLAGEWLETAGETDAVTMAGHFERGGEPARAVPWLIRATETALNGGDLDAVVEFGNRGIACNPGDADEAVLRVAQTHAMGTRGDWAAAIRFGREGMRLLPVGSTRWFLCASTVFLAGTLLGDASHSAELLPTMMDESIRPEPSLPYGTAVVASSVALLLSGQVGLARSIVERAEAMARTDSDPAFVLRLNIARAYVEIVGDGGLGIGLRKLVEALALAERLGDALGLALGSSQVVLYSVEIGDFARAETMARECITFSARLNSTLYTGWDQYYLARGKLSARCPEAAIALIEPILDRKFSNIGRLDRVRALRAYALVELDDVEGATLEATTVIDSGFPGALSMAFAALARLELSGGRPERALDLIERGCSASHASLPLEKTLLHLLRAQALNALGKTAQACAAIRDARDRVLRLAATLDEPALREPFLREIEANARTLALARDWLELIP